MPETCAGCPFLSHCVQCLAPAARDAPDTEEKHRARIFKLLRSPRIDSKDSIPPAYVCSQSPYLLTFFKKPRNRFPAWRNRFLGMIPVLRLQIRALAGRYDNPLLTRFLAPIDCLKIPIQDVVEMGCGYITKDSALTASNNSALINKCVKYNQLVSHQIV